MARRDRQKKPGRNGNGIGTPLPVAIALLPTPMAGDFGADKVGRAGTALGGQTADRLPDVIIHRLPGQGCQAGTAEPGEGRLLPTPDTGCSPNGHGRRGGRPGNGHQSGHGLDVAATALTPAPVVTSRPEPGRVGESTSRRSAAGRASSGTLRRRPPSQGRPGGPGCRPRSPSG